MNLIFFGSSPFSVVVLEKLVTSDKNQVSLVVTKPDRPVGRHMELQSNPVKIAAEKHGVPVTDQLTSLPTDNPQTVGLVAAYGKIIPHSVLNTFGNQIYNIHPSLLPKYRGASPLQQQILDSVTKTGVSLIQLDAEMDHGPIVAQEKNTILADDTWITLGNRLFAKGTDLFLNSQFSNLNSQLIPQDHSEATYTKKITRQDGFVSWKDINSQLSILNSQLQRKFRAYAQWPGIWTTMPDGKRLKLVSINPILVQIEGKTPQPWPL